MATECMPRRCAYRKLPPRSVDRLRRPSHRPPVLPRQLDACTTRRQTGAADLPGTLFAFCLWRLGYCLCAKRQPSMGRPNVLLIMADQQRSDTIAAVGSERGYAVAGRTVTAAVPNVELMGRKAIQVLQRQTASQSSSQPLVERSRACWRSAQAPPGRASADQPAFWPAAPARACGPGSTVCCPNATLSCETSARWLSSGRVFDSATHGRPFPGGARHS